jgi:hypothetical protein
MRKAQFFYLLRRGLLSGGLNLIKEGLVMASKFTTQGLSFPAQGSAEFNGTSDYIDTGIAPGDFPVDEFTLSFWAYLDISKDVILFSVGNGFNGDGFFIEMNPLEWEFWGVETTLGTSRSIQAPNSAEINKWAFITAVINGTDWKLYKDGSLITYTTAGSNIKTPTAHNATISKYKDGLSGYYVDGNLANVAIWNRALSSDEINSVMWKSYEGLTGAESNGLQAWYSLDDISGTSVPDSSGNGNDGTAY